MISDTWITNKEYRKAVRENIGYKSAISQRAYNEKRMKTTPLQS